MEKQRALVAPSTTHDVVVLIARLHPKTMATSTLAMIGSPAGSHGVTSSAKTIDDTATTRR